MNMPYYGGTLALKQEADLVLSCFHFFFMPLDICDSLHPATSPHPRNPVLCYSFDSTKFSSVSRWTEQFWCCLLWHGVSLHKKYWCL